MAIRTLQDRVEDPITKTVHHQVRDGKERILAPNELRKEYQYFKSETLVDIGEKLPYYHEAMAGNTHMTSSSENRVRVQLSNLGHFLPSVGDLGLLRGYGKTVLSSITRPSSLISIWAKRDLLLVPLAIRLNASLQ